MPHKFDTKKLNDGAKSFREFREPETHCEYLGSTTVRVSFLPYNDRTSKPFGFGGSGVKEGRSLTTFLKEQRGSTFESPSLVCNELA